MRLPYLILLTALLGSTASAQVSFSPIDSKLKTAKINNATEIICEAPPARVNFELKRNVAVMQQGSFLTIDNQTIQVTPLKFSGYKNGSATLSADDQKQLLEIYSKYELDYFKNELKTEVVNPSNQWVVTKGQGWFIWYFKVGNTPVKADKKTSIQLFASTVIADKILTINAPILTDGDFSKAALIVNDMMETIILPNNTKR